MLNFFTQTFQYFKFYLILFMLKNVHNLCEVHDLSFLFFLCLKKWQILVAFHKIVSYHKFYAQSGKWWALNTFTSQQKMKCFILEFFFFFTWVEMMTGSESNSKIFSCKVKALLIKLFRTTTSGLLPHSETSRQNHLVFMYTAKRK